MVPSVGVNKNSNIYGNASANHQQPQYVYSDNTMGGAVGYNFNVKSDFEMHHGTVDEY